MTDDETKFVVRKEETDTKGNKIQRVIILNPRKFYDERVVDEQEAILLTLKNIPVKLVGDNNHQSELTTRPLLSDGFATHSQEQIGTLNLNKEMLK
jgi:hypothetical protein